MKKLRYIASLFKVKKQSEKVIMLIHLSNNIIKRNIRIKKIKISLNNNILG